MAPDVDAQGPEPTQPFTPSFTGGFSALLDAAPAEPVLDKEVSARPAVVTAAHQYLKRWTFVLVVAAVWIVAAVAGLGLYYWWFHSLDKTPPVFVVLVYVVVCTVGSLLAAMVQNKPLVSALSIGLMSAPLAAVGGAAVLHGLYFCERASRCLVGLIPY
jgi:RsiW-degrading membrane proteinase PrsW (M82 family)